ncbi:MAG TPA: ribonuclease R [Verrucomicrobiae bacterium]|jgi:ribonuclease R
MEESILRLLGRKDYRPSNFRQLLGGLGLGPESQTPLQQTLKRLERNGQIIRTKGDRYILAREADLVPGIIRINRQGKGFLDPDDPAMSEVVVPESLTGTALNGDRVLVRRQAGKRGRDEEEGAVVRILQRKHSQIVGTLQRSKQFLFVIPDDPRIPHDIYVLPPLDTGRPANVGDKVVVELRDWESRHTNPEGEIIEVLGPPDAEGVDMLSVLRHYRLPLHFPKKVLAEAAALAKARPNGEPFAAELQGRVDCRGHSVITIDPDDAKDFDDAICIHRHEADRWKVWVHIADVSHYVRPGTTLDEEARTRGNSTYLVDRVIPMLPEALSNEICSLKPNVDRLTKCVEFLVSPEGRVLDAKFYSAVIRSKRRFTYKEALAVLQQQPGGDPISQLLHNAHTLAQHIRRARFSAGSLALDFPETKIRLDAQGRVLRIDRIENDVSHQLIEEYMLLANEAVASRLMSLRRPAIYRVHEPPDESRLEDYREEVASHNIPCGNLTKRPEVQKLLQRLGTVPIGAALKIGFLRSLMRARYAVEPLGHYGLAKVKYTHFTSPIRRYADLIVHRALFDEVKMSEHGLKPVAAHISETERNSSDAERDSKEAKLFAYLRNQIKTGRFENYTGLVMDVRNFGFFVDVSGLGMSGLVHLSSIEDDFYVFDAARHNLVGRRTRKVIQLGQQVQVHIAKVDTFKRQVDFRLSEKSPKASRPMMTARGGQRQRRPSVI